MALPQALTPESSPEQPSLSTATEMEQPVVHHPKKLLDVPMAAPIPKVSNRQDEPTAETLVTPHRVQDTLGADVIQTQDLGGPTSQAALFSQIRPLSTS
uniref:Uncharacterized protein n=1 Tax=Entomoneis paludosa TaxID=265537 RepID=A0A7S2VE16_9STRA